MLAGREVVDLPPVQTIAHADLDFIQAVQDVELGQGEPVDAGGAHGLAHQHGVEPAAAPPAPRDGAELVAAIADQPADEVGDCACGQEHDQGDRPVWVGLRPGRFAEGGKSCGAEAAAGQLTALSYPLSPTQQGAALAASWTTTFIAAMTTADVAAITTAQAAVRAQGMPATYSTA